MWYYRGRMGENSPPDGSCLQSCRASTVCEPHCEIQQRCSHFNILFQNIYLFLYYSQRMCACVPVCHGVCVEDTDNLWPQFYFIFSFYHTDAGNAPQATRAGPSPAEPSQPLPHIFRPVPTQLQDRKELRTHPSLQKLCAQLQGLLDSTGHTADPHGTGISAGGLVILVHRQG